MRALATPRIVLIAVSYYACTSRTAPTDTRFQNFFFFTALVCCTNIRNFF
jgi:hypothetical protein